VWAPDAERVAVRLYDDTGERDEPLEPVGDGYHVARVGPLEEPPTYRFVVDGQAHADPASRWQPEGVHGPSLAVDTGAFDWTDSGFTPPPLRDCVIYELHVGTFTEAGTFDAAIGRLTDLVALGVTVVEVMPVAAFPGRRNWGYDGVFPYAVQASYGGPPGFQRFVDACHQVGLAVVLDVVYNHLGPEGAVHEQFAPYFTDVYRTPWGAAVNVAEKGSDEVRRYFIENAEMWVRDYHVDGLRFDAIHGIVDPTASPFLRELTDALHGLGARLGTDLLLIAESGDNNPRVITSAADGGLGFGAQWNDDFHHSLHALLTGERDGYYEDFGRPDQLARAIDEGFVFQGEYSRFRGRRHGASSRGLPSDRFVHFAQNHDQIGNRAGGERLTALVSPAQCRLAAAVLLLTAGVPLLFMGEEYAETAPFPYFVDHSDQALLDAVRKGRAEEFGRDVDTLDPAAPETFQQAILSWSRRDTPEGKAAIGLYQALLAARRAHPVVTDPAPLEHSVAEAGGLLTVSRRSAAGGMLAGFNLGADATTLPMPASGDRWERVLDGEHLDLAAPVPDGGLPLPAYGFALCVPAGSAEDGGRVEAAR
jgi:maltooligosyltrehalose trehalohydrolase